MKITTNKNDPFAPGYESTTYWIIWYNWDKIKNKIKWGNMVLNLGGSWTDIYMFFYVLKNIPKQAIIYGNRYRIIN